VDFVLIRLQSDGKTTPATIEREQTLIGRQTGCQLRIRSGEVSRKHCEIRYEETTPVIKDLGSSNGTYVNGVRVIEKRLEAGDLIAIGPVVFLVQLGGDPSGFDAAALFRAGVPGGAAEPSEAAVAEAGRQRESVDESTPTTSGLMDGISGLPTNSDDSSVVAFDFDFADDDEDAQPPL
jgi:pSer/pThr/pTyr-binding forkhead associated (FHA) protein